MKTYPNNDAPAAGETAHLFLFRLCSLLEAGADAEAVHRHCLHNAKLAKNDASKILNRYQSRTDADALVEA